MRKWCVAANFGATFDWELKLIWNCIGFALTCSMIRILLVQETCSSGKSLRSSSPSTTSSHSSLTSTGTGQMESLPTFHFHFQVVSARHFGCELKVRFPSSIYTRKRPHYCFEEPSSGKKENFIEV